MVVKNKVRILIAFIVSALLLLSLSYSTNVKDDAPYITKLRVGALFYGDVLNGHSCSGSVIESSTKNLVLTAAHCISGNGKELKFAPAYDKGFAPFGFWSVNKVFIPEKWKRGRNSDYDYAVLELSPNGKNKNIEELTGGFPVTDKDKNNVLVTVPAYNAGSNDSPIDCTAKTFSKGGYLGFNCSNYKSGVSGGPMLTKNNGKYSIIGVIGGLEQGGCTNDTSYSSPINVKVINKLKNKAKNNKNNDVAPAPPELKCTE